MIDVWLVRHGQTDWNVEKRVQGWTDIPLNRTGIRQAQLLASALHGIPFQTIYTSDLTRAHTTASVLQVQLSAPLHVDSRLREQYFGAAEGTVRPTPIWSPGHEHTISLANHSTGNPAGFKDDREPEQAVRARAMQFLASLTQQHSRGRILCISHGGFIRAILNHFGIPKDLPLQNTSVTRLQWNGHEWRVVSVNWAKHLQGSVS